MGQASIFAVYARAVALGVLFLGSCLMAGHALLVKAWGGSLPFEEHLALASALGVFAFFLVSCAFGYAGWYGTPFLVFAPLTLIAFGLSNTYSTVARLRRHLTSAALRLRPKPLPAALLGLGYDSSLVLGADHVAALWAAPIFLSLLRFRERHEHSTSIADAGLVSAGSAGVRARRGVGGPAPA